MIYKTDVDKLRAQPRSELQTVPGTRSYHQYTPVNGEICIVRVDASQPHYNIFCVFITIFFCFAADDTVACKFASSDPESALIHCLPEVAENIDVEVVSFVVAKVGRKKIIGYVTDAQEEDGEVELTLLHPKLPASNFTWPDDLNTDIVPDPHIITNVSMIELENNCYTLNTESK